jgi:molybdopterin molybdotransferase
MSLISYQEAQQIVLSQNQSFGTEIIDLEDSLNRILAKDIFTDRDYPPFNRSAMDGIAIHLKDIQNGITQFAIIETIFAGQVCNLSLKSGECFKIMTGAAVPLSANLVIRIEDVIVKENQAYINLESSPLQFQNISQKGQDIKEGKIAIPQKTKITIPLIGLLASLGNQKLEVYKLPTVALITTGNEVLPVSSVVSEVQIRNSNQHVITASLKQNGINHIAFEHIMDDELLLRQGIEKYLNADILILCGGVSAGDADYVPSVLASLGVERLFHKVAIKPGKPIWCGKKSNGPMFFALPGNPFSCLVTYNIFIKPYLNKVMGLPRKKNLFLSLNHIRKKRTKFDEFFPLIVDEENQCLQSMDNNGSGDIRLGLQANAIALHPADIIDIEKNQKLSYMFI